MMCGALRISDTQLGKPPSQHECLGLDADEHVYVPAPTAPAANVGSSTISPWAIRVLRRAAFAIMAVILLSAAAAVASARMRAYQNPAVIQGLKVRPSTLTMAADGNDTITGPAVDRLGLLVGARERGQSRQQLHPELRQRTH